MIHTRAKNHIRNHTGNEAQGDRHERRGFPVHEEAVHPVSPSNEIQDKVDHKAFFAGNGLVIEVPQCPSTEEQVQRSHGDRDHGLFQGQRFVDERKHFNSPDKRDEIKHYCFISPRY